MNRDMTMVGLERNMADGRRTIDDSSGDSQKTGHAEGKEEEDDDSNDNVELV